MRKIGKRWLMGLFMLGVMLACVWGSEGKEAKAEDKELETGKEQYYSQYNRYHFTLTETSKVVINNGSSFWDIYQEDAYTGTSWRVGVMDGNKNQAIQTSLPAGKYYIYPRYSQNAVIEISAVNQNTEEMEWNDSFDDAQSIHKNLMYTASFIAGNDVDYYRIELDKPGRLDIEIFDAYDKFDCVQLYWEDEDLNVTEILTMKESSNAVYWHSEQYRLPSGIYYLKTKSNGYNTGHPYRFKVNYTAEDPKAFETEAYDLKENEHHVNEIKTNQTYTGNLQTSKDVDYYSFEVEDSSRVQVKFTQPRGTTSGTYQIRLFMEDEDGKQTNLETLTTNTNPVYYMDQLVLEEGTYYVEVMPGKDGKYSDATSFINYKLLINEDPIVLVKSIKLSTSKKEFFVGEGFTLKAKVTPSNAEDASVTWSSSDKTVAKIGPKGWVTCVSEGTCYLYATANDGSGVKATFKLEVKRNLVKEIKITGPDKKLYTGSKCKLTATVSPSKATNKTVTWMSSDPKIAKVDASGNVTCVAQGICYISATANDGSDVSMDYKLQVYKNPDKSIKNLKISAGSIDKKFNPAVLNYVITLPKNTAKVTLKWERNSTTSFVTLNGKKAEKSATKTTVSVLPGKSKEVKVQVKAQNGDTQTYKFTIKREK